MAVENVRGCKQQETSMKKITLGEKVIRDAATANQGRVCMGDCAPVFKK
jgi:hypothetical protein